MTPQTRSGTTAPEPPLNIRHYVRVAPARSVEFRRGQFKFGPHPDYSPTVLVFVDGQDLFKLVDSRRSQPGDDDAYGDRDDHGDDPGVHPDIVTPPAKHWLGSPDPAWSEGDWAVVFNCECGDWECGGTLARISVTPTDVVWSDFRGPRGGEAYAMDPIVFERTQYETALAALCT